MERHLWQSKMQQQQVAKRGTDKSQWRLPLSHRIATQPAPTEVKEQML